MKVADRADGASVAIPAEQYIDGRWTPPRSGRTREVVTPATNRAIAQVAAGSTDDMDAAVAAARRAFDEGPWPRMAASRAGSLPAAHGGHPRARRRRRGAGRVAQQRQAYPGEPAHRRAALGRLLRVLGRLRLEDRRRDAARPGRRPELHPPRAASASSAPSRPSTSRLLLASWKVAPALACGNTVVLKPSSDTPLTTLRLAEIAAGGGPAARRPQRRHRRRRGPACTSSSTLLSTRSPSPARPRSARRSPRGATADLKRVSLELGGKAPNIVFADAPLEDAVAGALFGVFWTQGEICTAGSRMLRRAAHLRRLRGAFRGAGARAARRRPARLGDADRTDRLSRPVRQGARLHRGRPPGGRSRAGRWRPRPPTPRWRRATTSARPSSSTSGPEMSHRPRGDLRAGRRDHALRHAEAEVDPRRQRHPVSA